MTCTCAFARPSDGFCEKTKARRCVGLYGCAKMQGDTQMP